MSARTERSNPDRAGSANAVRAEPVDSAQDRPVEAPARLPRTRAHNRQPQLLEAAARVFRQKGYAITTMRDIAAATGMTAGSIYYHYPSKGELLLAVYAEGVARVSAAVQAALQPPGTPWEKLERAMTAHLQMMVGQAPDDAPFAGVFVQVQPHDFPPDHHEALIALRNGYEATFRALLDALPL
jgi:AcrR family transcriptional regulator